MACSFKPLSSAVAGLTPSTEKFSVSVPCIVNTKPIQSGAEVVLGWELQHKRKKEEVSEDNAFDQLLHGAKKRLAKAKAKNAAKWSTVAGRSTVVESLITEVGFSVVADVVHLPIGWRCWVCQLQ